MLIGKIYAKLKRIINFLQDEGEVLKYINLCPERKRIQLLK